MPTLKSIFSAASSAAWAVPVYGGGVLRTHDQVPQFHQPSAALLHMPHPCQLRTQAEYVYRPHSQENWVQVNEPISVSAVLTVTGASHAAVHSGVQKSPRQFTLITQPA